MLHRHVWANDTFSNWHDEKRVHTKEEYANDTVFETKEGGKKSKVSDGEGFWLAMGNSEEPAPVLTEGEIFAREAAAVEAAAQAEKDALEEVEKILAKPKK